MRHRDERGRLVNHPDEVLRAQCVFDRTFDPTETATPFLGNYWRHLKSKQRYFIWFYVDEPGTYRISVKYYWYKTANIAAHEEEYYVDDHFGEFETDNTHTSCTFPA